MSVARMLSMRRETLSAKGISRPRLNRFSLIYARRSLPLEQGQSISLNGICTCVRDNLCAKDLKRFSSSGGIVPTPQPLPCRMSQGWRTRTISWKWTRSRSFHLPKGARYKGELWRGKANKMNTDGSEKTRNQRMIGQTKTVGFQIGVRRTFSISVEQAWDFLTSEEGQRIWLGEACSFPLTEGATYTTPNGAKGVI